MFERMQGFIFRVFMFERGICVCITILKKFPFLFQRNGVSIWDMEPGNYDHESLQSFQRLHSAPARAIFHGGVDRYKCKLFWLLNKFKNIESQ